MNELNQALGMNHRHKQEVPFSKSSFVSGLCGPVYADEGMQRRVLRSIYAMHKCGITSVITVLQECDSAQARLWAVAGPPARWP